MEPVKIRVKCLPHNQENMSSDPQYPCKKVSLVAGSSYCRGKGKRILGATDMIMLTNQIKTMSHKIRSREIGEDA